MRIAIAIFDGLTALDAVGPYEVLSRLPKASVQFAAGEIGPVRSENAMIGPITDVTLEQAAQAIQLSIEYDPQPPFDAGSPRNAPAEICELVSARASER